MLGLVAATLRITLATIFVFAGLVKLVGLPWSAQDSWNPLGRAGVVWSTVYVVVSVLEFALGMSILLAPALPAAVAVPLFLVPATTYGAVSIRRVGSCGCFGERGGSRVQRLIVRNGAVALCALALAAIESRSGTEVHTTWVPWVPLLNAALLALLAMVRLLDAGRLRGESRLLLAGTRPRVHAST